MKKESLHLGQVVSYQGRIGVVDTLTQTGLAIWMKDANYVICNYDEVSEVSDVER